MPEAESGIIALYGDSPRMKMIDFFMSFPKNEFTVPELVEGIGMSKTTAFREVSKLVDNDMIKQTGSSGKSPIYKINLKSPIVYSMQKLVSHRSKKIAKSQSLRSKRLEHLLRAYLGDLQDQELMLKNELKLVRTKIKDRTEKEIIAK